MGLKIYLIYLAFVTVNFLKCSFGLIKCFSDSIVSIKMGLLLKTQIAGCEGLSGAPNVHFLKVLRW